MEKKLSIIIGSDNFKEIITRSDVFVDKSLFIKEIIDNGEKSILVTYPRRWGKTINLDMLKTFFEPEFENGKPKLSQYKENKQIFEKLKIGRGGYVDSNEIAYRISLVKNNTLIKNIDGKWDDIAKSINFVNKEEILKNFKTDEKLNQMLEFEVKKYVLELQQKFSTIHNLENLINDYHKEAMTLNYQVFSEVKNEKLELLRKSIEEKIDQWKESDPEKYLEIKQEFDLIGRNQGKYPVIFFTMKDIFGDTMQEIENMLRLKISALFAEYRYLKGNINLNLEQDEINKFQRYIDGTISQQELKDSIKFLSGLLYQYYREKVYVLIDEYDKAVNYFLEKYLGKERTDEQDQLIKETVQLISQTVCSSVGKTNPYLEKLILVGIFDTTYKMSNSGCNNVGIHGISDMSFSKSFGFNEDEIKSLVKRFEFDNPKNILDQIRSWYDGYSLPLSTDQYIQAYTPWAVMRHLNNINNDQNALPQNYWTQSGASDILKNLFKREACIESELSKKIRMLTLNDSLKLEFDPLISLYHYDLNDMLNKEKVFTYLLFNSGYLTAKKHGRDYFFTIPNFEVKQEFIEVIEEQLKNIQDSNHSVCDDLLNNLYKRQHIEVFNAIKSNNQTALEGIFNHSNNINCKDDALNFNYFHIAALSRNSTGFMDILSRKCNNNITLLLNDHDKIYNLNVKDYIQFSNSKEIPLILDDITESLKKPSNSEYILCNQYAWYIANTVVISPAITAIVNIVSRAYTPKEIKIFNLYMIFVITGSGVAITKDSIKYFDQYRISYCNEYDYYESISTVFPDSFDSLKQFKKYSLNSEGKIYSIIGDKCENLDEELVNISANIFNNNFYGEEDFVFLLCQTTIFDNQDKEL